MSVNKIPIIVQATQGSLAAARRYDSVYAYYVGYITGGSATVYIGDSSGSSVIEENVSPTVGDTVPQFENIVYDKAFVRKKEMY